METEHSCSRANAAVIIVLALLLVATLYHYNASPAPQSGGSAATINSLKVTLGARP